MACVCIAMAAQRAAAQQFNLARSPVAAEELQLVVDAGLRLERRVGAVELGLDATAARFDSAGRVWFERSRDDGLRELAREAWVLDFGASAPRRPSSGELAPPPAARLAATLGALGAPHRICIDPGHGGTDPGAVGNGLFEEAVVLDVALRLRDLLELDSADPQGGSSWTLLLTRTTDASVGLAQRCDLANAFAADRFVSIHANSFSDPQANGTETYSYQSGTTGAALRDRIQARMLQAWSTTDRGVKTAGFYVLVNTAMPATLSELAFISNPSDAQLLGSSLARANAARAHLYALQEHFGVAPHAPAAGAPFCAGTAATCPCGNAGQGGAGCANSANALGALLRADGYPFLAADTLSLSCTGLPATTAVLFFQGTATSGGGTGTVFGDGLRCAAGTVLRLGTRQSSFGSAILGGPGDVRVSSLGAVPAGGGVRHYQAWYRNAASYCTPSTFNLSNGVTVNWKP
jgi:N-acetylmuramoyl-L-alanine amidase